MVNMTDEIETIEDPFLGEPNPDLAKRKFYNERNQLLTRALIWEAGWSENAIYTLKDWDSTTTGGRPLKSLKQLYLQENDLTEYDFAQKHFANWDHWQTISKSWYLKDHVAKWRAELEIRIVTDALKMIQAEALSESKYAYNANRYLADKGWKPKEEKVSKKGAGRPSKASIAEEAARQLADMHDIDEDLKRLGLSVSEEGASRRKVN
jgi:hypothetical protein